MYLLTSFLISYFAVLTVNGYESSELRCLVCQVVAQEIQDEISKENSTKTVDIGGYQMDSLGNVNKKTKPLVQSEMFLSDIMEKICDKMNNYVRATKKISGELVLINLSDLTSTNALSEVDIIQDSDLNRSLEFLCKGIVEEFEEDVYEVYGAASKSPVKDLCEKTTELCESVEGDKDEL